MFGRDKVRGIFLCGVASYIDGYLTQQAAAGDRTPVHGADFAFAQTGIKSWLGLHRSRTISASSREPAWALDGPQSRSARATRTTWTASFWRHQRSRSRPVMEIRRGRHQHTLAWGILGFASVRPYRIKPILEEGDAGVMRVGPSGLGLIQEDTFQPGSFQPRQCDRLVVAPLRVVGHRVPWCGRRCQHAQRQRGDEARASSHLIQF